MKKIMEKVTKKDLVIPLLGAPGVKLTGTTMKENLQDEDVQFETHIIFN